MASDEDLARQLQSEFDAEAAAELSAAPAGADTADTVVIPDTDSEGGEAEARGGKRGSLGKAAGGREEKKTKAGAGTSSGRAEATSGAPVKTVFIPVQSNEESYQVMGVYASKEAAAKALRKEMVPLLEEQPWGGGGPPPPPASQDLEREPFYLDDPMLFFGIFRKAVQGDVVVGGTVYVAQRVGGESWSDGDEIAGVCAAKEDAEKALRKKKNPYDEGEVFEEKIRG
ncbi:hypothetical protein DFJ74DRAFT_747033 [Hyaloraphidium curvatum]|nr:hypothetical protein DFJ74DRAFT_747033 [Hyaloraphidium curvatum]